MIKNQFLEENKLFSQGREKTYQLTKKGTTKTINRFFNSIRGRSD